MSFHFALSDDEEEGIFSAAGLGTSTLATSAQREAVGQTHAAAAAQPTQAGVIRKKPLREWGSQRPLIPPMQLLMATTPEEHAYNEKIKQLRLNFDKFQPPHKNPSTNDILQGFNFSDAESDDDEEEVDWEDAEDDEQAEQDSKLPALVTPTTPKPVTIDMNASSSEASSPPPKKKKKKRRKTYRYHSLPPHLQSLLLNIQRSHLLALTSRAVNISKCCSDPDLLHVANSLVPLVEESGAVPSEAEVRQFVSWCMDLVNNVTQRRRNIRAANEAAGAPVVARRANKRKNSASIDQDCLGSISPDRLLQVAFFLSPIHDDNPYHFLLDDEDEMELSNQDKVQLLVAMVRSKGWRARYVTALDPIGCDLTVDHPLFLMKNMGNIFRELSKRQAAEAIMDTKMPAKEDDAPPHGEKELGWVEILCTPSTTKSRRRFDSKPAQYRWMHVDPGRNLVDKPNAVEGLFKSVLRDGKGGRKASIAFALAVEHTIVDEEKDEYQLRLTDVTPRYASSWSESLRLRGIQTSRTGAPSDNEWWVETLKSFNGSNEREDAKAMASGNSKMEAIEIDLSSDENGGDEQLSGEDAIDEAEKAELSGSAANEAIPTSKAAFNNHPVYAIPSVLKVNEVFAPDAKSRICGIFKGQPVYRRSDVHTALAEKKWLYQGRKVKPEELKNPAKKVKARKKPSPKGFKALESYGVGAGNDGSEEARKRELEKGEEEHDGMVNIYGHWQTFPWSPPPVGPNDPIPTNEYKNVELDLINPGLVHLENHGMSKVAKKLGIPYAPCLLGFEGHGGNRTPTIRGIVVHEHNADILRCAHNEFMSGQLEREHEKRADRIRSRWQKLIGGVLTKDQLEKEFG